MSRELRVFFAGEGGNELGSFASHRSYWSDDRRGVLHSLLAKVKPDGWSVGGARVWKSIRKLRAGAGAHADVRNVLGVALDAREANCDVLVFSRDRDNDHARVAAIEDGIRQVEGQGGLAVAGAAAVPKLEGWVLALIGAPDTEDMSPTRAQEELVRRGVAEKDGAAMNRVVEGANLAAVPQDARSLRLWIERAGRAVAEQG